MGLKQLTHMYTCQDAYNVMFCKCLTKCFIFVYVHKGEYTGHKNSKYMVECCLSLKDDHVISGSEDGHVYMWDLIDSTVKHKLKVRQNRTVHSISHHPEENQMMVACEDKVYFFAGDDFELPEPEIAD